MSSDREATSEQLLLVCKEAGYDEVYLSGYGLEEDLSWSSKRELSAHSLDNDEKNYDVEE